MTNPKIDAEFAGLIPPLSAEELALLTSSLLAEGCRDALITWRGVLIDGHNRLRICQKHAIHFGTVELEFADREAARDWILQNQLGRRNLKPDQVRFLRGLRYNASKQAKGGDRKSKGQNVPLIRTSAALAKEYGVDERTIRRDGQFASVVERLKATAPSEAQAIVAGKLTLIEACAKVEKQALQAAAAERRERAKGTTGTANVIVGDFRKCLGHIADNSVPLIFTDPPYLEGFIPLFDDLGAFAHRVLVPGGSLVCYPSHVHLLEVGDLLRRHLRYHWEFVSVRPDSHSKMFPYRISPRFEPLLWFTKGEPKPESGPWIEDIILPPAKHKLEHRWQKTTAEAAHCIAALTLPGELVVDPYCGSGTTAVAAKQLGRAFITCDVDPAAVQIALRRLDSAVELKP